MEIKVGVIRFLILMFLYYFCIFVDSDFISLIFIRDEDQEPLMLLFAKSIPSGSILIMSEWFSLFVVWFNFVFELISWLLNPLLVLIYIYLVLSILLLEILLSMDYWLISSATLSSSNIEFINFLLSDELSILSLFYLFSCNSLFSDLFCSIYILDNLSGK